MVVGFGGVVGGGSGNGGGFASFIFCFLFYRELFVFFLKNVSFTCLWYVCMFQVNK